MVEFENLDQFETKIKEQLNKNDEEFNANLSELKDFLNRFDGLANRGVRSLVNEFYRLIAAQERVERKEELFKDLVDELKAYLARKEKITVSESEFARRKKRIKKVSKRLERLNEEIKRLQSSEISLEELGNEENNAMIVEEMQAKVLIYAKEKADLEHKHSCIDNDLNFDDIHENAALNEVLSKEILVQFKENQNLPNFEEVSKIVENFSSQNKVSLNAQSIFKKICTKLKSYRRHSVEYSLNSYLHDENLSKDVSMPSEDEELKKKLDSQNDFRPKIERLVQIFLAKKEAKKEATAEESESDLSDSEDKLVARKIDTADDDIISISSSEDYLPVPKSDKREALVGNLQGKKTGSESKTSGLATGAASGSPATVLEVEEDDVQATFGRQDYEEIEILSDDENDEAVRRFETNEYRNESSDRAAKVGGSLEESQLLSESRPEATSGSKDVEMLDQTEKEFSGSQDRSAETIGSETAASQLSNAGDLLEQPEASKLQDSNNNEEPAHKRKTGKDSTDENAKKSKTEDDDCILLD